MIQEHKPLASLSRKSSSDHEDGLASLHSNPTSTTATTTSASATRQQATRIPKPNTPNPEPISAAAAQNDSSPAKTGKPWPAWSFADFIVENRSYWTLAVILLATVLAFIPQIHERVFSRGLSASRPWPNNITSTHCTTAHPGRPLVQYVLMVDAGSMGSRIHVYKFNYCNATPELEGDTFGHVEPGLSSYDGDAEGAARSLDKLLNIALETVPTYLHSSTPVAVKATAGLRLLGEEKSEMILLAVRRRLESMYPFPIVNEQGVAVMDGADEGVYAWVTVNYLLERFNSFKKKPTVAILDLGGASTQVVFEPRVVNGHSVAQGEHRYPMNFNGNEYVLYQHSHLGYGLIMARSQINNYVVANPLDVKHGLSLGDKEYAHPCLPVGTRQDFVTSDNEQVVLVGVTDPTDQCKAMVEAIFYKHKECNMSPCSFNGVYQPSLHATAEDDIYAFSFFFDLTAPFRLGSATLAQEMTVGEIEELTDRVCIGDEDGFLEFQHSAEAMKELRKSANICMDLRFIYGLLQHGYGIPKIRKVKLAKKLKGYETGWTRNGLVKMDSSFWNKLKKTIMTTPKAQPSSALQLTRFNNGWLAIQTAISTAEKRNMSIQQTDIPVRLKNMVDLLVDEESRLDDATGTTGVCMEYLLKHNVLGKLVNLAEKDQPKGLAGETIRTFAGMINLLDDRFLVHNSVHKPTVKLLRTCCGPGTEFEENEDYHEDLVDLMYILCSKIHGYPELLNIFFYDRQWLTVPERVSARRLQKNKETMALLRSLSRRSSLALSSMEDDSPVSSSAPTFDQKMNADSLKEEEEEGDGSGEPAARPGHLARSMTAASLQGHENHQNSKRDYEFLLFTYLSKFVHREGKSGDFARTGLLFLMELATGSLGEYILDSEFSSYLTAGVGALYSQLPRKLIVKTDPNNLTSSSNTTSPPLEPKPSRRANIELSTSKDFQSRLDAFLRVLEFCQDVLMRCPNTEIATTLLASFKTVFLENILYPSILECSDTDGSSVAVISYIDLILQALEHEGLVDLVVGFLMASEEEDTRAKVLEDTDAFAEVQNPQTTSPYFMATGRFTLKDLVLSRLKSRSQPTVIATLKLLNTVITRHCKYSLKLLSIQPDNRATSLTEALDMPGQHPYRNVPLINHHAHELDLFFGLIATINPGNTQEIFCCGYESYLRDAEGSIEQHQCLMNNKTTEVQKTTGTGTVSEAELKKQRRRSTKYGHRPTDVTEDMTAEAFAQNMGKAGDDAASVLGHAGQHSVPMHRLLPSDPLLQILLGTLSHFFAHTIELNLALTGVITALAVCPYRSLEGWLLFKASDVKRPNVDRGSEEDSDSGDSQGLHLIDSEMDAATLNDSEDEDTLPSYLSRDSTKMGMEFAMPSGPPSFKSFPPFFTMLRTLTQQVDYYRSEIDGFDEYLADRRRTLLGTTIESTTAPALLTATMVASPGGMLGTASVYEQSGYNMFTSSESFFGGSSSDLLGSGGRPSTPTIPTGNLPHAAGGPVSQSGNGSRVASPAPQRSNTKTPVQGSGLSNPVSMVKISSPRARKSSSPSSLMSTPSNMSFLIPSGVGGKRNFKSNSTSPLATSGPRLPTLELDGQLASTTLTASTLQQQQQQASAAGPPRALSPVPLSQPRAIRASAPSVPAPVASTNPPPHHHQTNPSMSQSQLGNLTGGGGGGGNSALAKAMDTMMIKPLFSDGFVNDSDSEAEVGLDIEAELSDSDDSESDDKSSGIGSNDDGDEDNDTDEADRAVNSDLQEPSREARQRRRRQLRQQQKQKEKKEKQRLSTGSKGMAASSSQLLQSPVVQPQKRGAPKQPQQEQLVPLGQLLTNVVILEEVVKEVVAVAQVRRAMGVDKVRFL
ncbi:Guanosine-diphosphatase [Mortierella sp. 14UC]|nr:Guanosine-diphosphatase [Mortierella sp. 14UC]